MFDPWVGKIPWRKVWLPAPVSLPGECPWTEVPARLDSMGSAQSSGFMTRTVREVRGRPGKGSQSLGSEEKTSRGRDGDEGHWT